MTIQETDIAAVKRRLERIEQQCRLTKAAMAVVIVVASTVMLMGGQPEGKKGEPDRFVVRDAKGQERASLEMGKEGAALRFLDEGGKQRLWLGIANNTPGLVFYDGQGQRRAALSTGKEAVSLLLYDGKERRRASLVMSDDRVALHLLGDKGGRQHAGLSVEKDGIALWRHDRAGNIQSGANSAIKAGPGMSLHGEVVDPLFPNPE